MILYFKVIMSLKLNNSLDVTIFSFKLILMNFNVNVL